MFNYDESVSGDITNNPNSPLAATLAAGVNTLSATTGNADQEYVTVTVPEGFQLDSLTLQSYSSGGDVSFIGVQAGTTFTEPLNNNANTGNLLGYALFGGAQFGTNILDNIGAGSGAIGFTGSLPSGDYTFAIQQLGTPTDYTLDFNVSEVSGGGSDLPVVSFEAVPATISEEASVADRLLRLEFAVAGEIPAGGLVVLFENLFGITDQADSEAEGAAFEGLGLAPPFDQVNNIIGIRLLENQAAIQLPMINDLVEETTTFDFRLLEGDGYVVDPDQNSTLFTITDD
ncbi:MAG: peptidase, partial [Cyanobacteria bacterium P01_C01_bin.147]